MFKKTYKRNEQIKKLSIEHHFTLLFCWKIRKGLKQNVSPQRIQDYVLYFWRENLEPHFREEEKLFFAPVSDHKVRRTLRDHNVIKRKIQELSIFSPFTLKNKLGELADIISNHIHFEERILFPHLERLLSEEQFETIGIELEKSGSCALQDNHYDRFWDTGQMVSV